MAIHEECGVFGVMSTQKEKCGRDYLLWIVCLAAQRTGELRDRCE